ncbi:MAG: hypothetical protein AB8B99_13615 [Phormidesmis sp.]
MGALVYLQHTDQKKFVSTFDRGMSRRYNWPKLGNDRQKVALQIMPIQSQDGELRSGDIIRIKTTEARAAESRWANRRSHHV